MVRGWTVVADRAAWNQLQHQTWAHLRAQSPTVLIGSWHQPVQFPCLAKWFVSQLGGESRARLGFRFVYVEEARALVDLADQQGSEHVRSF